jgi:NitT/TauT family transport system ATP-binding protein
VDDGERYLVELDDVQLSYPGGNGTGKVVLDNVRIQIRNGEFVTMIGPSGGGKSTILRLILGSQFPTAGSVLMDGRRICQVERERGIVYQAYSLFPNLTVMENIVLGAILASTSMPQRLLHTLGYFKARRNARAEASRILGQIGLTRDDFDKYPQELSGGMRQRVAIAQAVIARPRLLLMDEPFGALDQMTRESMQLFALETWKQHGMTVVFVTHDIEEAVFLGTRIIGISQYWRNGDGAEGTGARVVVDKAIPGAHPKPAEWKHSSEFRELCQALQCSVLHHDYRQPLDGFDLRHNGAVAPAAVDARITGEAKI